MNFDQVRQGEIARGTIVRGSTALMNTLSGWWRTGNPTLGDDRAGVRAWLLCRVDGLDRRLNSDTTRKGVGALIDHVRNAGTSDWSVGRSQRARINRVLVGGEAIQGLYWYAAVEQASPRQLRDDLTLARVRHRGPRDRDLDVHDLIEAVVEAERYAARSDLGPAWRRRRDALWNLMQLPEDWDERNPLGAAMVQELVADESKRRGPFEGVVEAPSWCVDRVQRYLPSLAQADNERRWLWSDMLASLLTEFTPDIAIRAVPSDSLTALGVPLDVPFDDPLSW